MEGPTLMRRALLPVVLLALAAGPLQGQNTLVCPTLAEPEVDRIAAVVGDSIVLFQELAQECQIAAQRVQAGQAPAGLTVDLLLQNLIDIQVLLQHAARDSTVIPSAQDVERRVQEQIDTVRASLPSEAAFQQALAQQNLTLAAYREQLRAQIRTNLIRDAFERRLLQSSPTPVVSEAEMRAFYDEQKGQLQALPERLTVQQVLIRTGASDEAWVRARQKADSLHALVIRGGDFQALAREHSQDPGSAPQGGDLGWIGRGVMVPEFQAAAFALSDGGFSAPVRTEYGYHIILAERSRPGEKRVRHILISPEVVAGDLERTRTLGADVAQRIRSGESALRLAQTHGDPSLPREFQVFRGAEAESVPPGFAERLIGVSEGDVIGPFEVSLQGQDYVVVMHVSEVRAPGEFTYEEVREQIRGLLSQQKRRERIYEDLREKTYVEIRYGT